MPDSLKGHLLVAAPKLRDPNFFKSVVLLVQHDTNGSLGLVLNRPLQVTIRNAWKQLSQTPCQLDGRLHRGGPCEEVLVALHTDVEASDVEVISGLHFSTTKDAIEHLVAHGGQRVRLYIGYAGWSAGQLEGELASGSWLTVPATADHVFSPGVPSWEKIVRDIGHESLSQWIDPEILPDDPSVN